MKPIPDDTWAALAAQHGEDVVARYRRRLAGSGTFFENEPDAAAARALLAELAAGGFLTCEPRHVCDACGERVGAEELAEKRCKCGHSFEHEEPREVTVYFRAGLRSRDPTWLVTVHGMNTRGAWQEDFGWRLARIYGQAVPIAVHKYGRILVSPLLLTSQQRYARAFAKRLREHVDTMRPKYGERPDVIAHSFGTWLVMRALKIDPTLRLGRVVLTGSIVPPDLDWRTFLDGDRPRVEAVLCHHGGRDRVVPWAQFTVPASGPSGRAGFNSGTADSRRLRQHFEPTFGHSSYFTETELGRVMDEVWGPFLSLPASELAAWSDAPGSHRQRPWRRSWLGPLTHTCKYALLLLLAVLVLALLVATFLGATDLVALAMGRSSR